MATGSEDRTSVVGGRVHCKRTDNDEQRVKSLAICHDHFYCGKLMKFVSSLVLHRSPHYGSYDLLAQSSNVVVDDWVKTNGRFRKQKSDPRWVGVGVAHGGFDHSKSNILTFSVSTDDLQSTTLYRKRHKSSRRSRQQGPDRRSLGTDGAISETGVSLKRVLFASVDNLPAVTGSRPLDCIQSYGEVPEENFVEESEGLDCKVRVHNLRVANEFGGILDPDDSLLAVVEDKEQIVAIYDEQEPTTSTAVSCHGENGTSTKTNGHCSPALGAPNSSTTMVHPKHGYDARLYVQSPNVSSIPARFRASREKRQHIGIPQSNSTTLTSTANENSVVVGEQLPATASNFLVVRRGSEPVLNAAGYEEEVPSGVKSGIGVVKKRVEFLNAEVKRYHDDEPATTPDSSTPLGRFARTAARKSRLTDEWLEVAAQAAEDYLSKKAIDRLEDEKEDIHEMVSLRLNPPQTFDDARPLWSKRFQFEPQYENDKTQDRLNALIVRNVSDDSEAQERKLLVRDGIVDLNGKPVVEMEFEKAIDYFDELCNSGQPFTITVSRPPTTPDQYNPPTPVYPMSGNTVHGPDVAPKSTDTLPRSSSGAGSAPMAALQKGNTRRIGQRLKIDLKKKPPPDGFGFTLTSRDYDFTSSLTSDTGSGEALVYIKTICASGAAIEDGRLKAGDRLLEVNGRKLNKEFGQQDVVRLLRQIKPGETVGFVVSRQTDSVTAGEQQEVVEKRLSPALPRPLKEDGQSDVPMEGEMTGKRNFDQMLLTFDIPLNDTGSAGLGVSVKGRMAPGVGDERKDGGIFVKTILHGGAVHKDGRLRVNDRVIAVDGVDLRGLSNAEAMQRLRSVMMELKPTAQLIHLTVLRMVLVGSKEHEERERMSSGASMSDGGQHRLLVNEHSTNNGSSTNVLSYGDENYAVIMKNTTRKTVSTVGGFVGQWPNSEDDEPPVMIEWSQTAADHRPLQPSRSDSTGSSWTAERMSRRDIDEEGSSEALFVRDAPTRRSMSEKRHGAAKNDPSSTATFQRIQHQRQTSAPSLQRRPMGGGSLMSSTSNYDATKQRKAASESPTLSVERRSMSLESVSKNPGSQAPTAPPCDKRELKEKPLLHEEVAQSLHQKSGKIPTTPTSGGGVKWLKSKSAANRQRPTNESFRQAVDKSYPSGMEVGVDVDVGTTSGEPMDPSMPHAEPHYAQITHSTTADSISAMSRSRQVNKEKDRRKSTGSGLSLKNLFRFGSGGKANRPFAVVSPVNNESRMDAEENESESYGRILKKEERQKSQERERRLQIIDGADTAKYPSNGHVQTNVDYERQLQLEAQALARKHHEEEQWRIRQHYERMKEQQLKQQGATMTAGTILPGSNSPKLYPVHQKMPTQWKPPLPPSSPPLAKTHPHPVMGREMAAQIQHGRQHSGGGSVGSGSRMHSPGGSGHYVSRQAVGYYPQGLDSYYAHQYHPGSSGQIQPQIYGTYADGREYQQGVNGRHRSANNSSPQNSVSPPPQSSWFVDGVGGSAVRRNRFYYSSMDGRPSERGPTSKTNGTHHPPSIPPRPKDSHSASQLTSVARARCTSEHASNWSAANPSSSLVPETGQVLASSTENGTSNRRHQRNGRHTERSPNRHPPSPLTRVSSPDPNRVSECQPRVIIGSIPTFDSRRQDGITRIIVDHNNGNHGPPPAPPPDYEQYLRSRRVKKGLGSGSGVGLHQTRPCSEFIGDSAAFTAKYDCSSLSRKAAKKLDAVDVVMATPPARDVHYFYHPQQRLQ